MRRPARYRPELSEALPQEIFVDERQLFHLRMLPRYISATSCQLSLPASPGSLCVLVTENPAAAMDICDERRLHIPIDSFPLFYIPAPSIRETATVSACRRFGVERTLKPGTLASQAAADQPSIGPRARSRPAE